MIPMAVVITISSERITLDDVRLKFVDVITGVVVQKKIWHVCFEFTSSNSRNTGFLQNREAFLV